MRPPWIKVVPNPVATDLIKQEKGRTDRGELGHVKTVAEIGVMGP